MAPAQLRVVGGAGARRPGAAPRARREAPPSRLPLLRNARRRQDDARAHPRQVPELRDRHQLAPVRQVLRLPRDRRGPLRRPDRGRRRDQHQGRRDAPAAGERGVRADARPVQGLRDRRSAHALDLGVQRDAEDAGGAARARQVHPRDDRSAEDSGDRAVALPAVQPEADAGARDRGPSRAGSSARRRSPRRRRRCRLLADCARGSMRDALSLLDQAIAYGGGERHRAGRCAPCSGAIDDAYLYAILEAVARRRCRSGCSPSPRTCASRSVAFDAALQDLGSLLHRVALAQAAPDARRRGGEPARAACRPRQGARSRGHAALLSDRDPRPPGPAVCARRVRRVHDGAAAHARLRAGGAERRGAEARDGARGGRTRAAARAQAAIRRRLAQARQRAQPRRRREAARAGERAAALRRRIARAVRAAGGEAPRGEELPGQAARGPAGAFRQGRCGSP